MLPPRGSNFQLSSTPARATISETDNHGIIIQVARAPTHCERSACAEPRFLVRTQLFACPSRPHAPRLAASPGALILHPDLQSASLCRRGGGVRRSGRRARKSAADVSCRTLRPLPPSLSRWSLPFSPPPSLFLVSLSSRPLPPTPGCHRFRPPPLPLVPAGHTPSVCLCPHGGAGGRAVGQRPRRHGEFPVRGDRLGRVVGSRRR